MQRDFNLIRELLLFYESDGAVEFPSADAESIRQHLAMLVEAQLLDGDLLSGGTGVSQTVTPTDGRTVFRDGVEYDLFRVTWAGHDFLAAARDDNRWASAVKRLGPALGSLTLGLLKDYLELQVRKAFHIGGGD